MKKSFICILSSLVGGIVGSIITKNSCEKKVVEKDKKVDKFKSYYNVLLEWLQIRQQGNSLEEYFVKHGYKSIAIYGMGEMGLRLLDELQNSNIEIKYTIDKNAFSVYSEVELKEPDEILEPVDVIIVTSIFAFDEIKNSLSDRVTYPIISLEEVVMSRE